MNPDDITDPVAHEILNTIVNLRADQNDSVHLQNIVYKTGQAKDIVEIFIDELLNSKPPLIIGSAARGFKVTPNGTLQNKKWLNQVNRQQVLETRIRVDLNKKRTSGQLQQVSISWDEMAYHIGMKDRPSLINWAQGFAGPNGMMVSPHDQDGLWFMPIFDPTLMPS